MPSIPSWLGAGQWPTVRHWLAERRTDTDLRRYVVYVAALCIFLLFAVTLHDDGFLSASNLLNIGRQATPIAVMAVGMAFALGAGEIDLSVGSVTALSSLAAAEAVGSFGFVGGALGALLAGALIGWINGMITVKVRIPSFLVTLGMLGIASGIARNMNNLQSLPIRNDTFLAVFGAGALGPVSSLLIWTIVVGALGHYTLHQLRWGRHVLAVGADRAVAATLGINTDRVRVAALMASSTAAAFAGVLLAGRLAVGRHDLGENLLLTVIAAVVIGGTNLFGGRASVVGAIVGSIVMAMLNNGLILMGLRVADQLIARGVIIIAAVALSMREHRET